MSRVVVLRVALFVGALTINSPQTASAQVSAGVLVSRALENARKRGCRLAQLTSDRRRSEAHRFYERLGFTDSHIGYKLLLESPE